MPFARQKYGPWGIYRIICGRPPQSEEPAQCAAGNGCRSGRRLLALRWTLWGSGIGRYGFGNGVGQEQRGFGTCRADHLI